MGVMEKVAAPFAQHQVVGVEIELAGVESAGVVLVLGLEFELPGIVRALVVEFDLALLAVLVELVEVVLVAEEFVAKPEVQAMPGCLRACVEARQ
jgi:hypothetical protein